MAREHNVIQQQNRRRNLQPAQQQTSDLPTELCDQPNRTLQPANRTLQPANRTINQNHNL